MPTPSLLLNRMGAIVLLLATCISAAGGVAARSASAADEPKPYVPTTLPGAEVLEREKLDDELTGLSKDVPGVCSGRPNGGLLETRLDPVPGRSGVGVSPSQTESSKLQPGRRYYYCVSVINRGTQPETFDLSTVEFVGSPNPDQPRSLEVRPVSVGTWVHPVLTSVTVPGGRSYEVPFAIDVPSTVPGGTLAGGIRATSSGAESGKSAALNTSVIHLIYLTFPGGIAEKLEVSDVQAPRILSKKEGELAYRAKFVVRNKGTIVDVWQSQLTVKGLNRTVGSDRAGPGAMLPNEAHRVELKWGDLPWIGIYRPQVSVESRSGSEQVAVPWVLILPPAPFVIAILVALLLPILYLLYRWRRRRQEWMAYLLDEMEREERGEGGEGEPDEYWDPMRQP